MAVVVVVSLSTRRALLRLRTLAINHFGGMPLCGRHSPLSAIVFEHLKVHLVTLT